MTASVITSVVALTLTAQVPSIVRTERARVLVEFNRQSEAGSLAMYRKQYRLALAYCDSALAIAPWDIGTYSEAIKAAVLMRDSALARSYDQKGTPYDFRLDTYADSTLEAFLAECLAQRDPYWIMRYGSQSTDVGELEMPLEQGPERPIRSVQETTREKLARIDRQLRSSTYQYGSSLIHADSLYRAELLQLCDASRFPNDMDDGSGTEFQLLQILFAIPIDTAFNSPFWQALLPHVQRSIDAGHTNPTLLAWHADFAAHERNEPLPFGLALGWFVRKDGTVRLEERAQLNAARASLGLMSIEASARLEGVDLTKVLGQ